MIKDLIVIGGGPSGLTSCLYALRAGKSVLLLEKENIGGQISISPRVENFPSIKKISGMELANNLFEQISDLGVEFELDSCNKITKTDHNTFWIEGDFSCYEAKAVIVATGVKHRHINVPKEEELIGHGVSYCAVCDGAFYKGEDVCLIGDANTALQYAILLSGYCNKVYLNTLFDKFFGDGILVNEVKAKPNIIIQQNLNLEEFYTDEKGELNGLRFKDTKTQQDYKFDVKGCFIAIGQVPDNQKFADLVELNPNGFIITNENMQTKTPGMFASGDCREKAVRQLTTACGDGAIAAVYACRYIDSLK